MAERTGLTVTEGRATAEDFSRSTEDIRQDIAAKRAEIADTVDRLGDKVEQTFDWRTYVSEYPLVSVGVAAGLGMVASAIFKPRPSPRERVMRALAEGFEDATWQFRNNFPEITGKKRGAGAAVKAAATAMITKALTDYLKNRLSGLADKNYTVPQERNEEQNTNTERLASPGRTTASAV